MPNTPIVSITLPTICTLADETRVPGPSMPLANVVASASNASPPTISSAIITSVGRCHCAAITDNPTSTVYAQPITATSARSTRGTAHSSITLAAAARMTCPEGAELLGFDSKLIRYGRGSSGFNSSAAAKHRPPNTASCAIDSHRLRTISTANAIAPMMTLTVMTTAEMAKTCTTGASQPGNAASNFDQTISS